MEIAVPDFGDMLEANKLQSEQSLAHKDLCHGMLQTNNYYAAFLNATT
jgi:hypothetical protein